MQVLTTLNLRISQEAFPTIKVLAVENINHELSNLWMDQEEKDNKGCDESLVELVFDNIFISWLLTIRFLILEHCIPSRYSNYP